MLGLLRDKLPPRWHVFLYPVYNSVRERWRRLDRAFDKRTLSEMQFVEVMRDLGFRPGATVMLHSSFSRIRRRVPQLTPEGLIRLLQDLLGSEGTLLMPTYPFRGRQGSYVDATSQFDIRNTQSQLGVLTETFRKMPGVIRSHHPTHAVAGWGRQAENLLSTHHLGPTFGTTSPFYKLREHDGLVVGLGTRYRYSFTITHVAEELNSRARAYAFDERPRKMTIVDGDRRIPYEFRILKPDMPREYERISRIMRKEAILRYVTAAGLPCAVAKAEPFLRRALELAEANDYILRVPPSFQTEACSR